MVKRVPLLKGSIATHLLKVIFGLYFVVTIVVTVVQLSVEYRHTKASVQQEIEDLSRTFEPGLEEAIWSYNIPLLRSILQGMSQVGTITGVKIVDEVGIEISALGSIQAAGGERYWVSEDNKRIQDSQEGELFSALFWSEFPIIHRVPGEAPIYIATATIYSSDSIVFDRVEYGFVLILINSIIKTLALWVIFLFFVRRILAEPLGKLTRDIGSIRFDSSAESRHVVVQSHGQNELKVLERSFNAMIDRNTDLVSDLRAREEQYRSLVNNLDVGIYRETEADGLVQANPAMAKILGYSSFDELKGSYACDYFLESLARDQYRQLLNDYGQCRNFHVQMVCRDGSVMCASLSATLCRDRAGQHQWVDGLLEDISEKLKAEKIQRDKEVLEAANAAKSQFLAAMSHEIRTPMNAIIGLSGLALKQPMSDKQRDYLIKIETASHTLLRIINDILDHSKIEAGGMSIESVPFDLREVLDNLIDLISLKCEEKNLELIVDIQSDVPTGLLGDPLRLAQVLLNLAGNAVKFTDTGHVLVRISADLSARNSDRVSLTFFVEDTGIGLRAAEIGNLFSAFSQADGSITRRFGGSGLGLSISKELVELMGGEISVDSHYGIGSCFSFSLPFAISVDNSESNPNGEVLAGLRVLLIDDTACARQAVANALRSFSCLVDEAASAAQGLGCIASSLEASPYQLVLVDWQMPQGDGLEISRQVRKAMGDARCPIVLMITGRDREELIAQGAACGVDRFLVKPVTRYLLRDTVLGLCCRSPELRSKDDGQRLDGSYDLIGVRVLLVEDNEVNQQIVVELLRQQGCDVAVACDGEQAVQIFSQAEHTPLFDLILMDLQMPRMDGFSATKAIRQLKGGQNIPIIAMTAHVMEEEKQKCMAEGMDDHIGKPIAPQRLFHTIAYWVGSFSPRLRDVDGASRGTTEGLIAVEGEASALGGSAVINLGRLLDRVSGDRAALVKILTTFYQCHRGVVGQIQQSVTAGEYAEAERTLHELKGSIGNIGADQLFTQLACLEQLLLARDLDGFAVEFSRFESAFGQLLDHIREFISK